MHYIRKYRLDHVAFWLVTAVFYASTRKSILQSEGAAAFISDVIIHNALLALACYFNIYYLFERYFRKEKYAVYVIGAMALLLTYTGVHNLYDVIAGRAVGFFGNGYYNFSIGCFYIFFTLALVLSKRWYSQQLLLHQVQTEKLQTELQYLKAQMNPHFLFNSINTIYFQIENTNAGARESLEKFSELLRYQLYECNEDKIPIEKEISYLESYITLQRLRKNNNHTILFNVNGPASGFHIAPLILLPFVENAFKHLSDHAGDENRVELNLNRCNGYFTFHITNTVNPLSNGNGKAGIGLRNVKRRLDLLYGSSYALDIRRKAAAFSVDLKIAVPDQC